MLPVGAVKETVTVSAETPSSMRRARPPTREIDHALLSKASDEQGCVLRPVADHPGHVQLGRLRRILRVPTAYGSATNENVFLINGVNATNPEAGIVRHARQRQLRRG